MLSRTRKLAATVCLLGASSVGGIMLAQAAHAGNGATDTDDSLSNKGAAVTRRRTVPVWPST